MKLFFSNDSKRICHPDHFERIQRGGSDGVFDAVIEKEDNVVIDYRCYSTHDKDITVQIERLFIEINSLKFFRNCISHFSSEFHHGSPVEAASPDDFFQQGAAFRIISRIADYPVEFDGFFRKQQPNCFHGFVFVEQIFR